MITRNASYYYQRGGSLIELMIASLIGLVLLGVIGSVFITLQKTAREKNLELHLLQGLNVTSMMMKGDIQRAGYDGGNGHSLKLSGALSTIAVSGASSIGFVYFREGSRNNNNYRNIKYEKDGYKLVICETGVASQDQLLTIDSVGNCESLFDENIIQVTHFLVSASSVTNGSKLSGITDVSLGLQTKDGTLNKVASFSVKQRNWQ